MDSPSGDYNLFRCRDIHCRRAFDKLDACGCFAVVEMHAADARLGKKVIIGTIQILVVGVVSIRAFMTERVHCDFVLVIFRLADWSRYESLRTQSWKPVDSSTTSTRVRAFFNIRKFIESANERICII